MVGSVATVLGSESLEMPFKRFQLLKQEFEYAANQWRSAANLEERQSALRQIRQLLDDTDVLVQRVLREWHERQQKLKTKGLFG